MVNIKQIANGFRSFEGMSPKKLQKLCYYAYAWDNALEINEIEKTRFEAWVHGPVSPDIYFAHRQSGPYSIPGISTKLEELFENEEVIELIEQIWRIYGKFSGDELEIMTHEEGPWKIARGDIKPWESSNARIEEVDMMLYYSKLLDKDGQ